MNQERDREDVEMREYNILAIDIYTMLPDGGSKTVVSQETGDRSVEQSAGKVKLVLTLGERDEDGIANGKIEERVSNIWPNTVERGVFDQIFSFDPYKLQRELDRLYPELDEAFSDENREKVEHILVTALANSGGLHSASHWDHNVREILRISEGDVIKLRPGEKSISPRLLVQEKYRSQRGLGTVMKKTTVEELSA